MVLHEKKRGVFAGVVLVLLVSTLVSCASAVLKRVEQQETPMLKLVIARDMINQKRYELALRILENMKEEYAFEPQVVIEVDYEIAFLDLVRKRHKDAQTKLEAIMSYYDALEDKNTMPQWPYYLSKRLLETSVYPVVKKRNAKKEESTDNPDN